MRKLLVLGLSFCTILAFTSCKSSEKATQEVAIASRGFEPTIIHGDGTAVTPLPVTPLPVEQPTNEIRTQIRTEDVTYISGNNAFKSYGLICGSFSLLKNAEKVMNYLISQGYNPTIILNPEKKMYRVIADSYNDYTSAVKGRDTFIARYPGREDFQNSWVLFKTN